jgi:phosphoadenosine phosphosulfate reductase
MLGLAFSGGKDSLACWYLYSNQNPIVFWVNTGKLYPETRAVVNEVRQNAKLFVEVQTNQQVQNDQEGLPSDFVPIDHTPLGMQCTGLKNVMVQSYLNCCSANISRPLMEAAKEYGITRLIRGQRDSESHKSPSRHGSVVEGITFLHPIENWSDEQVYSLILAHRGELPEHFKIKHSSLDCYDCTAYVKHSHDRVNWMKEKHPELYKQYDVRMTALKSTIKPLINDWVM